MKITSKLFYTCEKCNNFSTFDQQEALEHEQNNCKDKLSILYEKTIQEFEKK